MDRIAHFLPAGQQGCLPLDGSSFVLGRVGESSSTVHNTGPAWVLTGGWKVWSPRFSRAKALLALTDHERIGAFHPGPDGNSYSWRSARPNNASQLASGALKLDAARS